MAWTNLAIVGMAAGMSLDFRPRKAYLLIQMTVMLVAGSAGVWLFYVQHQFEGVYWERSEDWDYATAALQGQFVLQTAEGAAVVLGQHRVSSHPSPEPAHSQLSPGEVSPGGAAVPDRQAGHVVRQLEVVHVPAVGRATAEAGRLRPSPDVAPAATPDRAKL